MTVEMRRTAELLPLVLPFAPACPDFVAEQQIRFAAIDFSERTRAWRHLARVDITDAIYDNLLNAKIEGQLFNLIFTVGGEDYSATGVFEDKTDLGYPGARPDVPPVAVIHEVEFAEFDGKPLTPVQFSSIAEESEGQPKYITQVAPNALKILPFAHGSLRVSMFLKPSSAVAYGSNAADPLFDTYNVLPDFFVTLHGNALAAGALARILSIPGKPWTDEAKAIGYHAEFEQRMNRQFRSNMRGQQRASIRTKPSWF